MKTGLIKSTFEKNEVAKKCPSIILSAWCFNSRRAFYSPDHNPHSHVPVKMESRLAQALWDSRTCPSRLPHVTEVSQHTPTTTTDSDLRSPDKNAARSETHTVLTLISVSQQIPGIFSFMTGFPQNCHFLSECCSLFGFKIILHVSPFFLSHFLPPIKSCTQSSSQN